MRDDLLTSWSDTATRDAIVAFLDDADAVAPEHRVAVLDNDGTLWCEKPSYIQLDFMIATLRSLAASDPSLHERVELAALLDGDQQAIGEMGLQRIGHALAELHAGIEPNEFAARARDFIMTATHPTLGRPYAGAVYQPMLELLDALRQRAFLIFIVTGGGTEFVRAVSHQLYGVTPDRVVGTLVHYDMIRRDGRPVLVRTGEVDGTVNEGPAKVAAIQRHLGQRPILAAGNSPGDAEMLDYANASEGPSLSIVIEHDDDSREVAYESEGATVSSERPFSQVARDAGWLVTSMSNDWTTVFPQIQLEP